MCRILLKDIINSTDLLTDAGDTFYRQLSAAISNKEKIVVDMSAVSAMPSVFLNVSIGRIVEKYGLDTLKKYVSFVMITRQQALRLTEYIAKYEKNAVVV